MAELDYCGQDVLAASARDLSCSCRATKSIGAPNVVASDDVWRVGGSARPPSRTIRKRSLPNEQHPLE